MSLPEKLKCKLLTPDADIDGRTGVTLYALSTILQMVGAYKIDQSSVTIMHMPSLYSYLL